MNPSIQVSGLCKAYPSLISSKKVLSDCSFEIYSGQLTVLIGKSGAGKSTLLKILSGRLNFNEGEILLLSQNLGCMKKKEQMLLRRDHMGLIDSKAALIDQLSLLENIRLPFSFSNKRLDPVYFESLCELLELKESLDYFPGQLSAGQCQKAVIARALITRPEIILADEPTQNLDWKSAVHVMNLFYHQAHNQGSSVLMACHDLSLAKKADRILSLENGKIIPYEI